MSDGISPADLKMAAAEVQERRPGARLVRNMVGNLAIMADGKYVGYLDLGTAEVELFDEAEGQ